MQSPQDNLGLLWPGLIVFLAVSGGVWLKSAPLYTDRPPNPDLYDQAFSDQRVPARLWQDPFEAIASAHKGCGADSESCASPKTCALCQNGEVHLVAAMVDGGAYAESAEARLRARYAILSGFDAGGYLPVDPSHIGCFSTAGGALPERIPFERLVQKDSAPGPRHLVLLWLNASAFNRRPSERIRALAADFTKWLAPCRCQLPTVTVLGPADSDGLAALIAERHSSGAPAPIGSDSPRAPTPLDYLAATATATESSVLREAFGADRTETLARPGGLESFSDPTVRFRRLVPHDGKLALELAQELVRRGLKRDRSRDSNVAPCARGAGSCQSSGSDLSLFGYLRRANKYLDDGLHTLMTEVASRESPHRPPQDNNGGNAKARHVVLISEWDTLYGRSLPVAVANALIGASESDPTRFKGVADLRGHQWLHYFSYMRGLDGNIPASKGTGKGQSGSAGGGSASSPQTTTERAEGQDQLDYLRRLVERIKSLKGSDGAPAKIFAIGILGSDLHDKTLILQALRPDFPAVAFFTTDLDARLRYTADTQWLRGLIVASGYGLDPSEYDRQAWIPPFRHAYQTATYLSVRQAFPGANPLTIADRYSASPTLPPDRARLYEIGRTGPVELDDRVSAPTKAKGELRQWRASALAGIFFAATLGLLLLLYQGAVRRFLTDHPLGFAASLLSGIAAIALLYVVLDRLGLNRTSPYSANPSLEPFSLASGISAWMPIYLLALAIGLSILFLAMLLLARWRVVRQIDNKLLSLPPDAAPGAPTVPRSLGNGFAGDIRWIKDRLALKALRESLGRGSTRLWRAAVGLPRSLPCRLRRGWVAFVECATGNRGAASADDAGQVWTRHRQRLRFGWRWGPPLLLAALFFLFTINLLAALKGGGGVSAAIRDPDAQALYTDLRTLGILLLSLLVFLYLDIAGGARRLIAELHREPLFWPDPIRRYHASTRLKVDPALADRWITLRTVARYADTAIRVVVYPLVVLLVLALARLPWFDTMDLPIGVMAALVLLAFYLLSFAWLVQRDARKLRDCTLAYYRDRLADLERTRPGAAAEEQQLRHMIGEIESMHDFAFQSFSHNPLLRIAILPFGTLGLGLLEVLG
jgi:hypothetical protein